MNYSFAYAVGFHPWEDAERMPAFSDKLAELWAEEEAGREPPFGAALDLGTGSGIWGVRLAARDWRVTAVDLVAKALRRARARVRKSGVEIQIGCGDVTKLRLADVGTNYRLVLDTGTFHGLSVAERVAMGREVSAVASDDATVLLLAWNPRRRGPLPRGASTTDIEAAFPGWKVSVEGPSGFPPPKMLKTWYRLRRE